MWTCELQLNYKKIEYKFQNKTTTNASWLNTEFLWELIVIVSEFKRGFVKAAVSRAVHLRRECPLTDLELRLYQ